MAAGGGIDGIIGKPSSNYPQLKSRDWERISRYVIDYYGGVCWICNHGGARQTDHKIPVTERPDLALKMENLRPAHGAGRRKNPCPECTPMAGRPVFCNQLRGMGSVERARRIIAGWIADNGGAPPKTRDRPEPATGREW